jgi:hypothetical protein
MLEVAVVCCEQREIPLSSRGGDPSIGRRDRPAGGTAFGHNIRPGHAGLFIRQSRCAQIDVAHQFLVLS